PFDKRERATRDDLRRLAQTTVSPTLDAEKRPYDRKSAAARESGREFDRSTYKSTLDADSSPAHEKLRAFVAKAKEKITVTIDSIFGGGGGGGGFGGQASGGWRTPLNRGTYR